MEYLPQVLFVVVLLLSGSVGFVFLRRRRRRLAAEREAFARDTAAAIFQLDWDEGLGLRKWDSALVGMASFDSDDDYAVKMSGPRGWNTWQSTAKNTLSFGSAYSADLEQKVKVKSGPLAMADRPSKSILKKGTRSTVTLGSRNTTCASEDGFAERQRHFDHAQRQNHR